MIKCVTRSKTLIFGIIFLLCAPMLMALSTEASNGQALTTKTFADISKKALPAVVSINVTRTFSTKPGEQQEEQSENFKRFFRHWGNPDDGNMPFFFPFQNPMQRPGEIEIPTAGSGVIISKDGYILTNYHVVEDTREGQISVRLNDDTVLEGDKIKVHGYDKFTDLAVLKVETEKELPFLEFGDSEKLEIGEWVLALGSPLELKGSVSQGIISAKNRVIGKAYLEDHIQTTAAINPGNSGGPLVNLDGKIVGINTAIASNTGRWQGVGFSIPSNLAWNISQSIISKGHASHGWLGITMSPANPNVLKLFGLPENEGVIVADVFAGSPAEKAGIRAYDIITGVDGKKITSTLEMMQQIASKLADSEVSITLQRPDENDKKTKTMDFTITLGERPSDDELNIDRGGRPGAPKKTDEFEGLGLRFEPREPGSDAQGLTISEVKPDSPGAKAGLKPGDIIKELNRKTMNSLEDFKKVLQESSRNGDLIVMFQRQNEIHFSTIETGNAGNK